MFGKKFKLFYIFVIGGVGIGKSYLIKVVYYEVLRILEKESIELNKIIVLLIVFIGIVVFNIGGFIFYYVFCLNKYMLILYELLKEYSLSLICVELENLNIFVIDEVLMVYKKLFYYIYERLV